MQGGKTIGVYSGSGGVGRTLIATSLAIESHRRDGARVLLVDASYPWPGDAVALMGMTRARTLASLGPLLPNLTPGAFAGHVGIGAAGVAVMPLVAGVQEASLVTVDAVNRLCDLATAAFDLVVIDMMDGVGTFTPCLVDRCDQICVVSDATIGCMTRARSCFEFLRSLGVPGDRESYCVNRMPGRGGPTLGDVERIVGVRVTAALPDDPSSVAAAAGKGMAFVDASPTHPITRGLQEMWLALVTGPASLRPGPSSQPLSGQDEDDVVRDVKSRIRDRLLNELAISRADLIDLQDPVKRQERRGRAKVEVERLLDEEGARVQDHAVRRRIVKEVLDDALGLGPLEDLLADPDINEIMVNFYDRIYVERHGKLELSRAKFISVEALRGVIERIVAPLGRRIDETVPMVDARLADGSRVNVIIPPLSPKGPVVTIRKFSKKLLGFDDLVRFGSLSEAMVTFLRAAVQSRLNVVISGGTGSGKTTLLNVLASFISKAERIVTIEDAAELQLQQEHVITLEARSANIEGKGEIAQRDLLRNTLRMRPDRIVIGECRAGEALDMLQAMNTGHDGSLTTIHANTPLDALRRIETLALMAGLDMPSRVVRDQIGAAINLVVQQDRREDGRRRITHITEVRGLTGDAFALQDVFVFRSSGKGADGIIQGQFVPTGHIPEFIGRLNSFSDIPVPHEIFVPPSH